MTPRSCEAQLDNKKSEAAHVAPTGTGSIPKKWLFHFCRNTEVTPRSCEAQLDNKKSGETRLNAERTGDLLRTCSGRKKVEVRKALRFKARHHEKRRTCNAERTGNLSRTCSGRKTLKCARRCDAKLDITKSGETC